MKKRILSAILSFAMILTLLPITALADGMPFTDVKNSDWFYDDVKNSYKMGLINGKSETTFEPDAKLTYAEAVKLAACMNQKYTTGSVTLETGNPWYQSYVDYAKKNKIITNDYNWNEDATRAGYISIFANALPDTALAQVNTVADGSIPDVPMTHPNAEAIYKLYRAGIIQGVDEAYNCNPSASIKRSEVSAILTRMMDTTARKSFSIGEEDDKNDSLKITQQPKEVTMKEGDNVTFSVKVSGGKEPYSYQWQMINNDLEDWVNMMGDVNEDTLSINANKDTLLLVPSYRCVITDADGNSVTSDIVDLIEKTELIITKQPEDVTCAVGDDITLLVEVNGGTAPYTYEWQYICSGIEEWQPIIASEENTLKMSVIDAVFDDKYKLRCVITDEDGNTVTSNAVGLINKGDNAKMKVVVKDVNDDYYMKDWNPLDLTVEIDGGTAPYQLMWEILKPSKEDGINLTNITETSQQTINYELVISEAEYLSYTEKDFDYVNIQLTVTDAKDSTEFVSFKLHPPLTIRVGAKEYQMESSQEKVIFVSQIDYGTLPYTVQWYIGANGRYDKIGDEKTYENQVFSATFEISDYDFDEYNTDVLEVYAVLNDANGRSIQTGKYLVDISR